MNKEAEPGTIILDSIRTMRETNSAEFPCAVTTKGRVCGTGIGAAYRQMVFLTSKRVTNSATALVKDSHRRSGSGPESSRKGLPSVSLSTRISRSKDQFPRAGQYQS